MPQFTGIELTNGVYPSLSVFWRHIVFRLKTTLASVLVLAVAGCAQTKTPFASSMSHQAVPAAQSQQEHVLAEQADALNKMSTDLVRKTTLNGAAIGALAGCGLAVVGGSKNQCIQAALVGGAVGAVTGHAKGKARVAKRVEIVELSRVLPSLRTTTNQLGVVASGVDTLIAEQDAEIFALKQQVEAGQLSQETYETRLSDIRLVRSELAQALSLSASQAKQANLALQNAQDQGQTGVEWYISATEKLEQDSVSARAKLSLL